MPVALAVLVDTRGASALNLCWGRMGTPGGAVPGALSSCQGRISKALLWRRRLCPEPQRCRAVVLPCSRYSPCWCRFLAPEPPPCPAGPSCCPSVPVAVPTVSSQLCTSLCCRCDLCCCLIPCLFDDFKDVTHTCPNCKAYIYTYKRMC